MSEYLEFFNNATKAQISSIKSNYSTKPEVNTLKNDSTDKKPDNKAVADVGRNNNNQSNDNSQSNTNTDLDEIKDRMSTLTSFMKESKQSSSPTSRPILGRPCDEKEETEMAKAEKSHTQHLLRTDLIPTNTNDIEVRQADPSDPLYSVKTFQELNLKNDLLKGIIQMNFRKPSGIQEKALPILLSHSPRNIIAQSQSGTGKTATFMLTMLSKVDVSLNYCQCLCMAPTRELALQIADVASNMSRYMKDLRIGCAIKGYTPDLLDTEVNAHIVIGTPGTLKFWTKENSQIFIDPRKLRVFVLDEADVLIDNPEFLNIANRIKSKLRENCQILLFSATYEDSVMEFAHTFVPLPTEFSVKPKQLTLKNIRQYYLDLMSPEEKYPKLIEIFGMKPIGQCIIFCESRRTAKFLQDRLDTDGHLSTLLSGELMVEEREQQLMNFRNAKSRVMIATNLCARGIDIPQVNLIINWDMPRTKNGDPDCETYLHRIGRSGRFGKLGLAINFIASADDRKVQKKIIQTYDAYIEKMTDLEVIAAAF